MAPPPLGGALQEERAGAIPAATSAGPRLLGAILDHGASAATAAVAATPGVGGAALPGHHAGAADPSAGSGGPGSSQAGVPRTVTPRMEASLQATQDLLAVVVAGQAALESRLDALEAQLLCGICW